jgi:hypothetical protein
MEKYNRRHYFQIWSEFTLLSKVPQRVVACTSLPNDATTIKRVGRRTLASTVERTLRRSVYPVPDGRREGYDMSVTLQLLTVAIFVIVTL